MTKLLKVLVVLLPFILLLGNSVLASDVLTLLSPNGGEVILSEAVYTIQWEAPSDAIQFDLMYSVDNGITWNLIVDGITGTSYDWYVPTPTGNNNNCLVRLSGYNSSGEIVGKGVSDMVFMIQAGN